ncbi:MAG: ATP-grasp domain-containing protein [Sedimenticola thiotaurini]|uniref:ATP-grasp domain-containing protein n=1 Tax=Sedimenticola thiotaurini TaxID=1543721 RepID=A0A558D8N5_9GAMM|nr:MAG: ATP-grasp domain-containing protein [Sedimenticola thiotaurini]
MSPGVRPDMNEDRPLLIVGNSVRYLAQSAARSGYAVTGVDLFSDRDTEAVCHVAIKAEQTDPAGLVATCFEVQRSHKTPWLFGAGFEAEPDQLQQLIPLGRCLGNSYQTLKLLADAESLFSLLDDLGIAYPRVQFQRPAVTDGWLIKKSGSCGGIGVHFINSGSHSSGPHYYQRYIAGVICSITFLANGSEVQVLGINQLFARDTVRGDFNYAGSLSHFDPGQAVITQMQSVALKLTKALQLRGANGIDFVLANGRVQLLDLNARPSATLELYDQQHHLGGVSLHIAACEGVLKRSPVNSRVRGSHIFYAPQDLTIGQIDWPAWCSDLPPAGTSVQQGSPVCGLHASGINRTQVLERLRDRKGRIARFIASSSREAA